MTEDDPRAALQASLAQLKANNPELGAPFRAERPRWPRGRGGHHKWLREVKAAISRAETPDAEQDERS